MFLEFNSSSVHDVEHSQSIQVQSMKSEEHIQFPRFPQAGHLDAVRCLLEAQAEVNRSSASGLGTAESGDSPIFRSQKNTIHRYLKEVGLEIWKSQVRYPEIFGCRCFSMREVGESFLLV